MAFGEKGRAFALLRELIDSMADNFGTLLAILRDAFPASQLERVTEAKLADIRREFPSVPEHYLAFLREVGHGAVGGWFTVYGGLVRPEEIFGPNIPTELERLVFFGDVVGSTIFGFDTGEGWRLVGVDSHTLGSEPEEALTLGELLARRLADE